ncbi:hypothetical protein [Saccharothrix carnea]|uniref:hypothetical protein n=1 Tax=Saccharothrix carnea TaxID=1280637 RepID=UPI0011B1D408|nr:hypothetical protein [Saccharothrix carnea]
MAAVLAVILVAGCGLVIGMGGAGDLVARMTPMLKLAAFGGVLVLVASAAWTLGAAVGPFGDQPSPVVPETGHDGGTEHGK